MDFLPGKLAFVVLVIVAQLLAWRYFRARLKKRLATVLLNFLYIFFNLLGFGAFLFLYALDFYPESPFLWDFVLRPALIWEMTHVLWLPVALLLSLIKLVWSLFFRREPKGLPKLFRAAKRGPSLFNLVGLALVLGLALAFYGYSRSLSGPATTRLDLSFPDLPPDLEGFKIALLADFHLGLGLYPAELQKALELAASEDPQIVLIAGDLVSRKTLSMGLFREPISALKAVPYGVYAVLGDSDHFSENPHNVTQLISGLGVRVLSDERVNIHGLPLTIIGFQDPGTPPWSLWPLAFPSDGRELPFASLKGLNPPEDNFVVVLCHRPEGVAGAREAGADLFLAGHALGGLIASPLSDQLNLAAPFYEYSSGLYANRETLVYVTRGLSSPRLFFRLFAWPEIAVITLHKGPRSPAPTPTPTPETPPESALEPPAAAPEP
ncbi:MAG: metallophosphoesterase [Deltaproteobacteria bacterium]|jgi:predicted MPP superfamily phosphohydrolase|nr:metallophosphoesterase [Deltaproteobacteria bacterium]